MGVRGALEFFSLLFFSIRLHGAVDGARSHIRVGHQGNENRRKEMGR